MGLSVTGSGGGKVGRESGYGGPRDCNALGIPEMQGSWGLSSSPFPPGDQIEGSL